MTKKDFFRIILKLFGLYALISTIFSAIPGNIVYVFMDTEIVGILWLLAVTIIIILLFAFLILKSDTIIKFFKLDKGFDDDRIDFSNFSIENIIKLALILIGGFVMIGAIPSFLSQSYFALRSIIKTVEYQYVLETKDYIHWVSSGVSILLGYFLMTNYSNISKFIKKINDKNENKNVA
jgi:hypothetical protein